jgi:hypothetical protein
MELLAIGPFGMGPFEAILLLVIPLLILIPVPCAFVCALLAEDKGKNSTLAFLMGLLFGLYALIYYAATPTTLNRH